MLKRFVQQGRSERRGEAYSFRYVEPLSAARTLLANLFSIRPRQRSKSCASLTDLGCGSACSSAG
jgi:hypothetical protein